MIANKSEYRSTKTAATKFAKALKNFDSSLDAHEGAHPSLVQAEKEGIASQLISLQKEMQEYDNLKEIRRELLKIGYINGSGLVEYWFNNENWCVQKLDSLKPTWGQRVSCQLRWKTQLGKKLAVEVRSFIDRVQKQATEKREEGRQPGDHTFNRAVIDFNELYITIGQETKHINDWLYTISSRSTYEGWTDLRGIDLTGVSVRLSVLQNACFANADFSDAVFNQVEIRECNFPECDFSRAFIAKPINHLLIGMENN